MASIVMRTRRIELAEFEERISRAVTGFRDMRIGEGDVILLLLRNDTVFLEASAAASRIGAYTVAANWHGCPDEIAFLIRDSGARAVVAHTDLAPLLSGAGHVPVLWARTPDEIVRAYDMVPAHRGVPEQGIEWDSWLDSHAPALASPRLSRGVMTYTSGTTGLPKSVRRMPFESIEHERSMSMLLRTAFGLTDACRTVVCGPLYHAMPNVHVRGALAALQPDGVIVIEPRFDAARLLELIETHRIQQLILAPVMFVRLLRLPESERRRHDLGSLKYVIHSAAPCPVEIKRRMIEWWGPIIHEFYGTTETGLISVVNTEDWLRRPGTVGRALPGATIRILDEWGAEVAAQTPGEVCAINSVYPDFTYHNHPGDRERLDRGGLVATGDVGYLDEEGYLFLCDRKKDLVISGGVNIFPVEIESHLHSVPEVRDCAVFGIPDEEFGEALAVHLELMPGAQLTEGEVRAFLARRLAKFKVPRVIRFDAALPRDDNGKIYKRRLAEPYWEGVGRRI